MDVDLLAKMVKEVMMDQESVTLPGVGSFVAEWAPASFADKGYTIHPPYRRLFFTPRQGTDTLLADLYARSNDVSQDDATQILVAFLTEMKDVLEQRKTVALPGLGRLRATRENHFFFVADEDLDIYPAGFGLAPISLKTHEETPEEVAAAVSSLADLLEQEAPAVIPAETPVMPRPDITVIPGSKEDSPAVEEMADQVDHDETEASHDEEPSVVSNPDSAVIGPDRESPAEEDAPAKGRGWKTVGWVLLSLIGLVLLAGVALAIMGRVAPEWLDPYLYTPEQLEILYKK